MKTTHPKLAEVRPTRKWFMVDAKGKVLGQVAVEVANILRGKNKVNWHPSLDCGDHVVVINAAEVVLTGQKETKKEYIHHTGYPGGIRRKTAAKMREDHPERIIEKAVAGMIPRNRLKKIILSKLHVYAGADHKHEAQKPEAIQL